MDKLNKNFRGMIQYSNSSIEFNDTEMLGIIFNMVDEYNKKPKETHEDTINDVKNSIQTWCSITTSQPGTVYPLRPKTI